MEIDTVAIADRSTYPAAIHCPQTVATRDHGAFTGVSG
jgi:hypothetical protein